MKLRYTIVGALLATSFWAFLLWLNPWEEEAPTVQITRDYDASGPPAILDVSQAIDRVNESAELLVNTAELKQAALEDSLIFEGQDDWGIYATFSETEIIIGRPPLVVIDMATGQAILHGDPNEAARLFWDAVEKIRGMR